MMDLKILGTQGLFSPLLLLESHPLLKQSSSGALGVSVPSPVGYRPQVPAARRGMAAPSLVALGDHWPSRGAEASGCSGPNLGPQDGPSWAVGYWMSLDEVSSLLTAGCYEEGGVDRGRDPGHWAHRVQRSQGKYWGAVQCWQS